MEYQNNTNEFNSSTTHQSGAVQLVFSILETLTCSIFGMIALILYFVNLKPALDNNDLVKIKSSKKVINILLIVGIIIPIFLSLILIMLIAIPNYSGIQNRMEMRSDTATAAQIGKAVRVWYTDAVLDADLNIDYAKASNNFVKYSELDKIENYLSTDYAPTSYTPRHSQSKGAYYVAIAGDSPSEKVIVAIGPEELNNYPSSDNTFLATYNSPMSSFELVNYDGTGSGIAYIENTYQ